MEKTNNKDVIPIYDEKSFFAANYNFDFSFHYAEYFRLTDCFLDQNSGTYFLKKVHVTVEFKIYEKKWVAWTDMTWKKDYKALDGIFFEKYFDSFEEVVKAFPNSNLHKFQDAADKWMTQRVARAI